MPFSLQARTLVVLGGEDVGVAGVGVAPAQVAVQLRSLDGVVGVVLVGEGELPQWPEVRLDRVRPGRILRREALADPHAFSRVIILSILFRAAATPQT